MLSTNEMLVLAATLLASALLCFLVTREVVRKLKGKKHFETELGLVVPDLHKPDKPSIPKLGGIGVAFGIAAGVSVATAAFAAFGFQVAGDLARLFAMFTSVIILGLVGLTDDVLRTRYRTRVIAPLLAVIPILAVVPDTTVAVPFAGVFGLGWLYYVIAAAGFVVLSNAVNMVGGFNGSETGLGSVTVGALLATAVAFNQLVPSLFLAAALGAFLAFLRFNWFPARCLPGNMTTHIIGSVFAASALVGKMEFMVAVLSLLYVTEFFLKARGGFHVKWWGTLQQDGTLKPSDSRTYSIHMFFMKHFSLTERGLVARVVATQAAIAIIVVALTFYGLRQ